jgi:chloramphenicol-sensitive protein RarD
VHELWREGRFSWASVLVALGFPAYFSLRKHFRLDHMGGLWIDMTLTLPVGLWFVVSQGEVATTLSAYPALAWLVPGLGVISASALALYVMAGRHLPFGLFGLLGYVEPVLLLGVAWMLGERIAPQQWLTYGPVWLAVGLLVIEGLLSLRRTKPEA